MNFSACSRDIWRNSDTGCAFFLHKEHSSLTIRGTLDTCSLLSEMRIGKKALQIDFMLPPANALTIFSYCSGGCMILARGGGGPT